MQWKGFVSRVGGLNSHDFARIRSKNLQTLIMTLSKSNSLEFARFRIQYELAEIQIEFEANLHPYL